MILYPNNILAAPLLVLMWTVDLYVFLASLRLLCSRIKNFDDTRWLNAIKELVDPLPALVGRQLARRSRRTVAPWLPWVIVILGLLLLRPLLAWTALSML